MARFAVFAVSCTLMSCSEKGGDPRYVPSTLQTFGAEDKRTAQALSIGSRSVLDAAQSPYDRAVLCKVAVDSIAPRVGAVLGAKQAKAFDVARTAIEQKLRDAAREQGKSRSEVPKNIAKQAEDVDPSMQGRLAIACLRDLA